MAQGGGDARDLKPTRGRGGGVLERFGESADAAESTVRHFNAPGVPYGAKHGLLVIPADAAHLDAMLATERGRRPSGHAAVDQHQLQPSGDTLCGEVVVHHSVVVLVDGGGYHESGDGEAGDVDGDDALGALGAAERASAVVEGRPAVGAPRARCVSMTTIDGLASVRPSASRAAACSTVSARAQVPFRDQRRNCDHTRVQRPNDSGK